MKCKYNPVDDSGIAYAIEGLNVLKDPKKFIKESAIKLANVLNKAYNDGVSSDGILLAHCAQNIISRAERDGFTADDLLTEYALHITRIQQDPLNKAD